MKVSTAFAVGLSALCMTATAGPLVRPLDLAGKSGVVAMFARSIMPEDYDFELKLDAVNEICLNKFPDSSFTIECEAVGSVEAVKFSVAAEGKEANVIRVEGVAPFNIAGDVGEKAFAWKDYPSKVVLVQCMGFARFSDDMPLNTIHTVVHIIETCAEESWEAEASPDVSPQGTMEELMGETAGLHKTDDEAHPTGDQINLKDKEEQRLPSVGLDQK
jgi:hypothetical protein